MQGYAAAAVARGAQRRAGLPGDSASSTRAAASPACAPRAGRSPPTPSCAPPAPGRGEIGAMAGVEIPVHGEPRHMWFSPEHGGLRDDLPLTIDFSTSFYFHREGPGIVFGGREEALEDVAEHALRRAAAGRSSCRSRAAGGATTRSAPTTTRSSASRPTRALPVRDRVLRARLPAGARDRRAPRAADPRRAARVRPRRVLARALRARRAARRALRRLTGAAARGKRMTGRPPFRPLRRRTVSPKGSCTSARLQPTSATPGARGKLCDRADAAASGSW